MIRSIETKRSAAIKRSAETKRSARTLTALFALAASMSISGCGYSEKEWQAQLDKYNKLASENQAEKDAHEACRTELEDTRMRVAELRKRLNEMGVNLDAMTSQVEQTSTEKAQLSQSLEELQAALEEYKKRAAQLERIKGRYEQLQQKLKKLTELGLKVEIRHNRMVIRLPGDVLYASGSDKLRPEGIKVVGEVAKVIRNDEQLKKRYFQVAGHTDNKPLRGGKFGDNWGLSAMRGRQVLLFLVQPAVDGGGGLSASRLHAAGYGDIDPVATNDSNDGRAQNRRVELVLMPDVEEMLDLKNM